MPLFIASCIVIQLVVCCFDIAMLTCQGGKQRSSIMKQLNVGVLKASKISNIVASTASHCSMLCLNEPGCIYVTRNAAGTNCTLYTRGSTIYDVRAFLTFGMEYKNVKVIIIFLTKSLAK